MEKVNSMHVCLSMGVIVADKIASQFFKVKQYEYLHVTWGPLNFVHVQQMFGQ